MLKKAKVTVHPDYRIGKVDKRLFGAFLESIGNTLWRHIQSKASYGRRPGLQAGHPRCSQGV